MPGYQTQQQQVTIAGTEPLLIRCLLDRQQFSDPLGKAARLGISSAAWPMFGLLWPSGMHLAAHVAAHLATHALQPGQRFLEVGCGLALASLVGHRRGADMTASDCHPLAPTFLAANLQLNHLPPMKYRYGEWDATRHTGLQAEESVSGRYDIIMGSDVLYDRDASTALAGFIGRHAMPASEVWIVDPERGNRPAFSRLMADIGYALEEVRLDGKAGADAPAYKGRLLCYRRPRPQRSRVI